MIRSGNLAVAVALLFLVTASSGCAYLSRPMTPREQTAGIGGLAGGATGAIIGSMAGSAVAGGLFGIPLGAVAGYFIGDQLAQNNRTQEARMQENEQEIQRLREENQRLKQQQQER